jgi:hypothetical protein
MKNFITILMLSTIAAPAFSDAQTPPPSSSSAQSTTTQIQSPPKSEKEQASKETAKDNTVNIIDFCRSHTC